MTYSIKDYLRDNDELDETDPGVKLLTLLNTVDGPGVTNESLDILLYTASERGIVPDDVDSVSNEMAILCWQIVELARTAPAEKIKEFRM